MQLPEQRQRLGRQRLLRRMLRQERQRLLLEQVLEQMLEQVLEQTLRRKPTLLGFRACRRLPG